MKKIILCFLVSASLIACTNQETKTEAKTETTGSVTTTGPDVDLIKKLPKNLDSTDGLAAAVCHLYNQNNTLSSEKNYSGWSAFVKQNERRIKK